MRSCAGSAPAGPGRERADVARQLFLQAVTVEHFHDDGGVIALEQRVVELTHIAGPLLGAEQIDERGTIDVLRHGVDDLGVHIRLAFFRPASQLGL